MARLIFKAHSGRIVPHCSLTDQLSNEVPVLVGQSLPHLPPPNPLIPNAKFLPSVCIPIHRNPHNRHREGPAAFMLGPGASDRNGSAAAPICTPHRNTHSGHFESNCFALFSLSTNSYAFNNMQ